LGTALRQSLCIQHCVCLYEVQTSMERLFNKGSCKKCVDYQWVSYDGIHFSRDDLGGTVWPYPLFCSGNICTTSDSPTIGFDTLCWQTIRDPRWFITCICCDDTSICFKWKINQGVDAGCIAVESHTKLGFLSAGESKTQCAKGH